MASTLSPNMNLIVPGVGTQPGPQFAFDVNASLTLVDQHDHSLGKGVQITPDGLNINADLSYQNNSATNVEAVVFTAQSSFSTLQSLYVAPGVESPLTEDLWFNDGNGIAIQLTSGGLVNATIASLPGQSYAAGTFFWKQGNLSTTPANFDIGSITLRPNIAATTYGITISPPAAIASAYDIKLPLLPAAQSFMTIDNSGNILAPILFANGITASNIAAQTITATQIANSTITATQLAVRPVSQHQVFTASGTFTTPSYTDTNTVYKVTVVGGGASGGKASGATGGGGGGGGGAAIAWVSGLAPLATVTVTVGNGGALVSVSGAAGNNGGTSSFGAHAIATGGNGGAANAGLVIGGNGGSGTAGSLLMGGTAGGWGGTVGGVANEGGAGGGSFMGGGGSGGAAANNANAGQNYGGGGGGSNGGNSGAGAAGVVMVEWTSF